MLKKRTEEERKASREKMEKCIYGMHLTKEQTRWVEDNDSSNDNFAKFLFTSPKTKNRALQGYVTEANMISFAEQLSCNYETMKAVNLCSMWELICFRFMEKEHRRSMLLVLAMFIIISITILTDKIGPKLLLIICADLFLHSDKNFWNLKMDATKNADGSKCKLMSVLDIIRVMCLVVLVIMICFIY